MKKVLLSLVTLSSLMVANAGVASEKEELLELKATIVNLIGALQDEGVISKEKAAKIIQLAKEKAKEEVTAAKESPLNEPVPDDVVRVPYVPEFVKNEIREQVRNDLRADVVDDVMAQAKNEQWGIPKALPDWISRVKWKGDIRLREQSDLYADDNLPNSYLDLQAINNAGTDQIDQPFLITTEDRNRLRVRARLGMDVKVDTDWKAGFTLATGSDAAPVSTNQTLGDYGDRYSVYMDEAYLKYTNLWNQYPWLTLTGGRMPNPWLSTDLVWDGDLRFDGLVAQMKYNLSWLDPYSDETEDSRSAFLTLGILPLDEFEQTNQDKLLLGAQAGIDFQFSNQDTLKVGLAYYDYRNVRGQPNTPNSNLLDYTAPAYLQKGNNVFDISDPVDPNAVLAGLASDFNELNLTASYDIAHFSPTHIVLTGDYVKNIGFDGEEISQRTGQVFDERTEGYQLQVAVGWLEVTKLRDWQLFTAFKHLERDAVLDAFTDSDFHLGGTDAQGWILGGKYGVANNTWVRARLLSTEEIDRAPLGIDVFQLDLNAMF